MIYKTPHKKVRIAQHIPHKALPESRAIINDLDVILHVFMLQIIFTTGFRGMNITENSICVQE
jgi:hypothetical protein